MGNQTLVPSQIQSVESYFLDMKSYIQFRASLGSTTFMKTAKVNLIESNSSAAFNEEFLIETRNLMPMMTTDHHHQSTPHHHHQSNILIPSTSNANSNTPINITTGNSNFSAQATPSASSSAQQSQSTGSQTTNANIQRLNQQQIIRQRLQALRDSQQQVVIKIFPKYDMSIRLDLYSKRVREIKSIIYSRYGMCTNCLPFAEAVITDRAAFLFRQYIRYNLYDRLSTRPFLSIVEKKWLAFQLLCAVNECHSLQIVHGDIKTENVLINSFLWVSLADFASYKPVYLSKNHPSADFNYYFDISRRRTCYLAPERLDAPNVSDHTTESSSSSNMHELPPDPNDFKPSMDIFALGCVIAELFMERPLFDFAHLLAYRERKYDPSSELAAEIGDKNILDMVTSMLALNPNDRKTANEYLQEQNDKAFPSYFVFLKNYISRFISVPLTSDDIIVRLKNDLPLLLKNFKLVETTNTTTSAGQTWPENLNGNEQLVTSTSTMSNSLSAAGTSSSSQSMNNDAFLILLSLLLSCVRKLKFTENKLIAIETMLTFSKFLDDSIVLDRVLPYYLALIDEQRSSTTNQAQTQAPIVKAHVIYALNDCLASIYKIDVQNLNVFPEIIFDCLEALAKDESFLVRSTIAKTIASFALTSLRYLDTVFLTRRALANNTAKTKKGKQNEEIFASYDKEYESYQSRLTDIIMYLITDINQSSSSQNAVKETLIRSDISKLCSFFSRQKTSEFLLPHMITILNEKTDWWVRAAFFDALCPVLTCIGWESVEIVKSLLEQGLRDSEEFVIYRTLITLGKMVEVGLLDRAQICYFLGAHISPLLCHPSLWIRHGAVNFVAIVCKQQHTAIGSNMNSKQACPGSKSQLMNAADILCSVAPVLAKFLERADLINFDSEAVLFNCLKKPIKRAVYDCIAQDGCADALFVYLQQRSEIRCLTNFNYLPGYVDCADANVQRFFERLCALGFREEDEDKLLHLKEFMDKTRISRLSSSLHNADSIANAAMESNNLLLNASAAAASMMNLNGKDGYITIMKEKFQRCNCEYLNMRKENIESSATTLNTRTKSDQGNINVNEQGVGGGVSGENTTVYNPEWKLMFGKQQPINIADKQGISNESTAQTQQIPDIITTTTNQLKKRNSTTNLISNQKRYSQASSSTSSAMPSSSMTSSKYDCSTEVEKYLDRSKLIYDEHKLKHQRALKLKETINSSLSSHTISLSSSIGKWKPKGFLIAHSNEHTKEINKLSRNVDSTYFSTCSTAESCVKIWTTDNLLDGKSGFFKSVFTYDRQSPSQESGVSGGSMMSQQMTRPCCTTFYNKNSLAILCEDFRFYVIDFNSNRTRYRLYANETLFKANTCKSHAFNARSNAVYEKTTLFYYLNKPFNNKQQQTASYSTTSLNNKCSPKMCFCSSNYPIEMIRIDDSCHSWPIAAANANDYFTGGRVAGNSNVKGLFCYSTSTGDLTCIDMRTRSKAFDVKRDLRKGYITSMCTDPYYTWLATGTSTGDIEIYDFRFMLPVKRFEHHYKSSVVRLCNHPSLNSRIIASYQNNNEIAVWNMDKPNVNNSGNTKQTAYDPEFVFWGEQSVPPLCQKKLASSYIKYVSGMVGCSANESSGTNGLICVSTDMKMRYIDLNMDSSSSTNNESYVVSAAFNFQQNSTRMNADAKTNNESSFATSLMSQNVTYENRQIEGTKVLLELDKQYAQNQQQFNLNNSNLASTTFAYNSPALVHQSYFTHHQDAITDLVVCYNPLNNKNHHPLMITSARDGALKIWR